MPVVQWRPQSEDTTFKPDLGHTPRLLLSWRFPLAAVKLWAARCLGAPFHILTYFPLAAGDADETVTLLLGVAHGTLPIGFLSGILGNKDSGSFFRRGRVVLLTLLVCSKGKPLALSGIQPLFQPFDAMG